MLEPLLLLNMTLIPIEDRKDVVKHKESAAILAADFDAFQAHMNKRKQQILLEKRVTNIESELSDIKTMLSLVLNKLDSKV